MSGLPNEKYMASNFTDIFRDLYRGINNILAA